MRSHTTDPSVCGWWHSTKFCVAPVTFLCIRVCVHIKGFDSASNEDDCGTVVKANKLFGRILLSQLLGRSPHDVLNPSILWEDHHQVTDDTNGSMYTIVCLNTTHAR